MGRPWRGRQKTQDRFQDWSQAKKDRYMACHRLMHAVGPEQVALAEKQIAALPPLRERVRRPVDGKPVGKSEHQEQCAVVAWWSVACLGYGLPRFALFAIPNGGARDSITGARLKAEGVRPGAPDLCLAAAAGPHHGLFIEMKKVDGDKPNDKQEEFKNYLEGAGYKTAISYGADAAITEIEQYLKNA